MQEHRDRVEAIAAQVKSFHERGQGFRIYHGTTSTTRKTTLSRSSIIDTSGMNHVLSIDREKQLALVEPNVSMEGLLDSTLASRMLPPVVMELPSITVGGGFAGTSGESSSFRCGLFDKTVNRIEIILANGEIVWASQNEQADLFHAAAGSFGTFGVITMLEMQLIPAREYVELTYSHVSNMDEAVQKVKDVSVSADVQYIEGIMYSLNNGVMVSGKLTDDSQSKLQVVQYTRPQDPWFYIRAEEILRNELDDYRELVPVKDYFFRHDRGTFWGGKYAFQYFLTPFNSMTRRLLDRFMRADVMYHALHKSRIADECIVQDIGFPCSTVGDFVEFLHRTYSFYPLWLCPVKMDGDMSLRPHNMVAFASDAKFPGMMINVGLWGPGPKQYDRFISANREIERKTAELGGLKCFYAQAFYTPDEFWNLYDKSWYDQTREKYKASGLPSVYEKINVDLSNRKHTSEQYWQEWLYEKFKEQWPVRGVYGFLHVLFNREYLLSK